MFATSPLRKSLSSPSLVNVSFWPIANITTVLIHVRFSNRPFGVKRFQAIRHCSVDVARGLVLLFGIGPRALVWGFRCQVVRQGSEAFLRRFLGLISKPVSSSRP